MDDDGPQVAFVHATQVTAAQAPRAIPPAVHLIVAILLSAMFVIFLWKFIQGFLVTPVNASFTPFVNGKPVPPDSCVGGFAPIWGNNRKTD